MLNHIRIRNFAIIDHLDLDFKDRLTTLTGETGAGKSILLGALGLLLGDRADSDSVRAGSSKAEISAEFDITQLPDVDTWLTNKELDADGDCLLRRRLSSDGRSRAFINGTPVPLQDMRQLGEMLVDIHGQHEHQSLMKPNMQRQLLDDYAQHAKLLNDIRKVFNEWNTKKDKLIELQEACKDKNDRVDLLRYQVSELVDLSLNKGETEALQSEHQTLANADKLNDNTSTALENLYDSEDSSIYLQLSKQANLIESMLSTDDSLSPAFEMLSEAMVQIEETASLLRDYKDNLNSDPQYFSEIETRLGIIHDLSRKHHIEPDQLIELSDSLTKELNELENADENLSQLESDVIKLDKKYKNLAIKLTNSRTKTAKTLNKQISESMQTLGMSGGKFKIQLSETNNASINGSDQIEYMVSTNAGQPFKALAKTASGGELARISLAIQMITAQQGRIPTLIFDEVDSGVGGGIAEIVGKHLRMLGESRQVFCITHLPQVASQAHHHMQVYKHSDGKETRTEIIPLEMEQRIDEISRMLGGIEITKQTIDHAKDMLDRSQLDS
ncbi:MAG: DNA repair protein RecN [endosymbiont of Galathealinum brachiosum]|uniref:DNA repair protein RecN n=1 Tax=endosymbiont of Galathealinum brachiosum TaxID=2200906 RepID=A0A370DFQ9_9GAMM|nr:MAG: DNA repair protein RecN [endosymbiont of Galathealinum brachiosum]